MNEPISAIRRLGGALLLAAGLTPAAVQAAHAATAPALPLSTSELAAVLVGTVRDSSGTPLPNVQVHLATLQRTTLTDQQGQFAFRGLGPGSYHLDSYFLGFAPGHADVVVPAGSDTVRLSITMRQTPLRLQGVQVTAAPTGDTRSATQATTALTGEALSRNLWRDRRADARQRARCRHAIQRTGRQRAGDPRPERRPRPRAAGRPALRRPVVGILRTTPSPSIRWRRTASKSCAAPPRSSTGAARWVAW